MSSIDDIIYLTIFNSFVSCFSIWRSQKQGYHLKKFEKFYNTSNHLLQKIIEEKNDSYEHIYHLYNILNDLDQILGSLTSYFYHPPDLKLTDYDEFNIHINEKDIFHKYITITNIDQYEYIQCTCEDVRLIIYSFGSLFQWIENKKNSKSAINAMHIGKFKDSLDKITYFFHTCEDPLLRITKLHQRKLGKMNNNNINNLSIYHHKGLTNNEQKDKNDLIKKDDTNDKSNEFICQFISEKEYFENYSEKIKYNQTFSYLIINVLKLVIKIEITKYYFHKLSYLREFVFYSFFNSLRIQKFRYLRIEIILCYYKSNRIIAKLCKMFHEKSLKCEINGHVISDFNELIKTDENYRNLVNRFYDLFDYNLNDNEIISSILSNDLIINSIYNFYIHLLFEIHLRHTIPALHQFHNLINESLMIIEELLHADSVTKQKIVDKIFLSGINA